MISTKVMLVSTGALSAAMALGVTAPAMTAFLCSELPRVYRALLLWLTPPYLYLVINGIIISIAASSRFQKTDAQGEWTAEALSTATPAVKAQPEDPPPPVVFEIGGGPEQEEEGSGRGGFDTAEGGAEGETMMAKNTAAEEDGEEEEFFISRSSWTPEMRPLAAEKPLVSMRFGGRKGVKASPEGRALRVAKPRRYETLESTWKTITDGRPMPLPRHLRKSDTWGGDAGGRAREESAATQPPPPPLMRKAETFGERRVGSTSPSPGGSSKGRVLRREASPGQDELNRRVEAFIKKFNEEMRLQRQESFKNYMDMISRGT
ncbi:hypothetical protein Taro_012549 [Colocasia esculenta]|uniref:DUF4408 domain-containing protein n=1 Tax=Colocasia esculenta TaxID=4460 RepID=A0A843U4A8_COLES|nr:hypothetical protein [Colocasia esculenta]